MELVVSFIAAVMLNLRNPRYGGEHTVYNEMWTIIAMPYTISHQSGATNVFYLVYFPDPLLVLIIS